LTTKSHKPLSKENTNTQNSISFVPRQTPHHARDQEEKETKKMDVDAMDTLGKGDAGLADDPKPKGVLCGLMVRFGVFLLWRGAYTPRML
jgi:hypothetical protein